MQRTNGARVSRARKRTGLATAAALATGALTLSLLPATGASAADEPGSAWGKDAPSFSMPPVKVGTNKPTAPQAEAKPSDEVARWRAQQKERARGGKAAAARVAAAEIPPHVPEGQGDVPWHRISNFAITDALTARINYSTGNLMLTATDFSIAGVGQELTLARTYNSLDAPWGKVSQRWWQQYERYLQLLDDEVVLYDASGDTLRYKKASDGSYTTPKGYSKELKKNTDGTYTVTNWKTHTKDTYNEHGTLTKVTDKNKGTITIDQHDKGDEHKGFKLTETRSGRWIDLVKTDASQWQAKDNTGRTAVFDLDPDGNLHKTTDAEGKTTTFGYDTSRRLTKITTAEGRVTVFTYDNANRITSMLRATELNGSGHTGPTWTYEYDTASPTAAGTTKVTDPEEHVTRYEHDGDGQVEKVTDALGHKRSTKYDANHNVDSATDAMGTGTTPGNVTDYGFNTRNNLESVKSPTGGKSVTSWQTIAGGDKPKDSTNADGEKTSFTYDTAGNTKSVAQTGTGGGHVSYTYNPATPDCGGFEGQRCTEQTKMSSTKTVKTSFTYDDKGNLTKVTPPKPRGQTTYTYDALGRTETLTDGRGIKKVFTYDHLDRIKTVSTTHDTVRYHYDGDGNLRQRDDSTGTITYQFDPLQRETIRTLQDGSQTLLAYTPAGNVDYYQDPTGKTDYTWNEVNKLKEFKDPQGKTTTYKYNNNDIRTQTTYPGGTVQTVDVDNSSRPKNIKATSPKGTLVDLTYTYGYGTDAKTDGDKIRTKTDAVTGMKTSYTYDGAGRFSYAAEKKGSTLNSSWQYCYDMAGNLTSQGTAEGCPRGTTYTINDAQQIISKNGSTTNWSYDAEGHETAGASTPEGTRTGEKWSDHSQLTSLTVAGQTYAGQYGSTDQSERIKLGGTYFHNGPLGLSATSTDGVDTGFNREPGGTLNSMTRDGKTYFYLTDALGSVVALADESGTKVNDYSYSPRGVTRAMTSEKVSQPYRFAGGYQDPTGLYHYAARYYDPNIGRFTQPDPSGQEQNPYLYAEGDPVNRIDPTGLFDLGATIASVAVGAAATVAVGAATGNPVAAAAAGGCAGGAVGEGLSGGSAGDMGKACAAWGIGGAISGGLLKGIGV
ncbi:RHS repeat protein [Streptomyces sp. SID335]|nr:RHS repeat protein [Streptomyces sp. SID335]NDZ85666.1 RHS repeat-associated core domain-containing protein [Streptomyces sp. SID10115]NEA05851.1 RHS repeat-associated core domain-containing protein [Streptomyces sp. SID10116]NEB50002.1 RHS repeat-associated core domain-containing protein [Streptomyces sp. SID339]